MQVPRDETGHCKGFGFVQVGGVSVGLDDIFLAYVLL